MRLRDTVQSKWLKVVDLPGRENGFLDLTISKVGMSRFSDGRESVDLYFHEVSKPLGANTTNRKRLMAIFGEDIEFEDLIGKRVRVYAEMTQDAKGEPCWGMRLGMAPPLETLERNTAPAAPSRPRPLAPSSPAYDPHEEARARAARIAAAPPLQPTRLRTMPQDEPDGFARPMSHRPAPVAAAPALREEPPGFVDDQVPGADDPFGMAGGRW